MALFILLVTIGYLMGSICSAVIVCRVFSLPDPRIEGSKNPGATNVLRLAGKHYAAIVVIADILKGTLPVLLGKVLGADPTVLGFTALAAVVGHIFPVFFGFKGGKGVATALGGLLGLQFMVGIVAVATWLTIANFSRYSSLASIITIIFTPIFSLMIVGNVAVFPPLALMTLLILFKHRYNITRLMDGVEPKLQFKHSLLEDFRAEPTTDAHEVPVEPIFEKAKPAKAKKPAAAKAPAKKVTAAKPKAKKPAETAKTTTKAPKVAKPAKKKTATKKPKE